MNLFDYNNRNTKAAPLAYRMRPRNLGEMIGQKHLLGEGSVLKKAIERDDLSAMIFFGPPGTGKTSLAQIIAQMTQAEFVPLSSVTSGVADIRKVAANAEQNRKYYQRRTILFVDEIHRFNKSQQDVLLPFVEDGTLILIGATTENPLYELNNALLSRVKLYLLEPLTPADINQLIEQAIHDTERGLGQYHITIDTAALNALAQSAKGDARMVLNILETIVNSFVHDNKLHIDLALVQKITGLPLLKYDRTGDYHYDTISAFIKSIRGSDPDAALYWLAVMLEGGEDPKFIARRLIIHAAEDIGLADPFALVLANAAADAINFVGLPEGRIPLAEATIYLSTAPKSNTSKSAIDKAMSAVRSQTKIEVPLHLSDSSHSQSGSRLGKGRGYKYPPSYGGYVKQEYLPPGVEAHFYDPTDQGYEKKISSFLNRLRQLTGQ